MEYRLLGSSQLRVSRIAFGCMSLGENAQENERLLHCAFDLGINFFDTADLYQHGRNEEFIGRAFRDRRDQVILATKVGNQWRPDGSDWDWNPRKDYILAAVDDSLRRLQTDYIDLYQLHGGTIDDPVEETIEAFERLKEQGKIRHYGLSSIRPNVIREWARRSRIVSNMMQYSLLDRRPEEEALDLLQRKDIGVIVRGGLARGLLAGKPTHDYLGHLGRQVRQAVRLLASLVTDQRTLGQAALRYCLAHPAVTTIAAGASRLHQLEENAAVFSTPPFTEAEYRQLQEKVGAEKYIDHR